MNAKTTWCLLALAIGLFAYVLVFDRPSAPNEKPGERVVKLFAGLDPAKVTGLEISRSNLVVRAERQADRWQLTSPPYPAEPIRIQSFLQVLQELPQRAYIAPEDLATQTNALAAFGLQPSQASVTVRSGTNRLRFLVGAKTLLHEQLYVQRQGEAGVAVTDAQFLDYLPASAAEWRNPMLLHLERLNFDRLAITNANSPSPLIIEFDPTNQLWNLAKPLPARADFAAVDYLVQQLRTTRISQFITDDPNADADRFGLQPPGVEMTLAQGTNPVFQVQFGNSPTNDPTQVFARRLSHSNIVLVSKELVDLLRLPHEKFRDRTLLPFATAMVDRIEIKTKQNDGNAKESFALARETNGAWKIVQPFRVPADPGAVRRLFETLSKLKILHFGNDVVTDFSPFALAKPPSQYILMSTLTNAAGVTNRIVAQLDLGTNNMEEVFVRRGAEASVYTVGYFESAQLPSAVFEMRDRHIWNFDSTNVASVIVRQHGQTNRWVRDATRAWSSDQVLDAAVEETLHRLGQLEAVSWRAKGEPNLRLFGFTENPYEISLEVTAGGQTQNYLLKLGKRLTHDDYYASVVLEEKQPIIFLMPGALYRMVAQYLTVPVSADNP